MRLFEYPLHPWLFAAYPLIAVATSSFGQVAGRSLLLAVVVAWVVVAASVLLTRRLCRGSHGAALLASLLVAVFFSYGHIHGALDTSVRDALEAGEANLPDDSGSRAWHAALTGGALLLLLAAALLVRALPALRSARVSGALNFAAMFLLAATGVQAALAARSPGPQTVDDSAFSSRGSATSVLGYNPDIYYVILDGYARADILREQYGFDNSAFIDALRQRGFAVNDRSSANYYWTFLSLASSLNLDYLHSFLPPASAAGRPARGPAYRAVRDNRAARLLRERGYRIVHLRSSWGATFENPYADEQPGCDHQLFDDEYFRVLAETSWLRLLQGRASEDLAQCHLRRLDLLAQQARRPGPKFVFAHFLPPHHPYLFDSEGTVLRHTTVSNQFDFQAKLWERHAAYVEQLQFVNRSMLGVIDHLVAHSSRPPVIIIQSDHGPQLARGLPLAEQRRVRLANFSAFLLPGAPPGLMPPDTSPVNVFRRVFNHYFGAGFDILPQRSYFSPFRNPYELERVPPEMLAASPGPATVAVPEDP